MRTVHSLFSYVFGSQELDTDAAMKISGWSQTKGTMAQGGHAPSAIHAISKNQTEAQKDFDVLRINALIVLLFGECGFHQKMNYLLLGSLMKYWSAFVASIAMEPNGKFDKPEEHIFVKVLETKLFHDSVRVTWKEWELWCKNVKEDFVKRNFMALPANVMSELPEGTQIDLRTLREHFENLVTAANRNTRYAFEILTICKRMLLLKEAKHEVAYVFYSVLSLLVVCC